MDKFPWKLKSEDIVIAQFVNEIDALRCMEVLEDDYPDCSFSIKFLE